MACPVCGLPADVPEPQNRPRVVAVVGATATGKSDLAIELAERLGAEVVNADAFQVYRGMDIGTAKVPRDQCRTIPHHLVDILDIAEPANVAHYQTMGRRVLEDLGGRGVPAVVVGGSGLYVRALLDDLRFPGSDPEIRTRWEQVLAQIGPERLHGLLAERDPQAADHILPTNHRRVVRALEVGELTGQPYVAVLPPDGPTLVDHVSIGLDLDRTELDRRIARRVARMFADGLVGEVRTLLEQGLRDAPTASRALGYPQVIDLIDGRMGHSAAEQSIVVATRRYARRQQRWFRRDPRTIWFDAAADPVSTASTVAAQIQGRARTLAP